MCRSAVPGDADGPPAQALDGHLDGMTLQRRLALPLPLRHIAFDRRQPVAPQARADEIDEAVEGGEGRRFIESGHAVLDRVRVSREGGA